MTTKYKTFYAIILKICVPSTDDFGKSLPQWKWRIILVDKKTGDLRRKKRYLFCVVHIFAVIVYHAMMGGL